MTKQPAIFLDRDGTIIEDNGYINKTSDVIFFKYTFEALQILQKHFLLFIITNQSGISKGLTTETEVKEVNKYIVDTLKKNGIEILDTFYCPHKTEDNCECKKPKPHFIQRAVRKYQVDLAKSFIIGDHPSDVECGMNAAITPLYVLSGHGSKHKDELLFNPKIFNHLSDATKYLLTTI